MPNDPQPTVLRSVMQKIRHWMYDFFHRARVEAQIDPTHPPHVVFWRFFHFYTRRHSDALIAFLLIISLISSQLFDVVKLYAASYTVTWDSQSDFTSNASSGFATSTIGTLVSTSTPGSIMMVSGATTTLSENFGGTYNLDSGNSTAVVSGGVLQRNTSDTFTNLTSLISGSVSMVDAIVDMEYDAADNYLFFVMTISGTLGGRFDGEAGYKVFKLNLNTNVLTTIATQANSNSVIDIAYDPTNNVLLIVDTGDTSRYGMQAYTVSNGTLTSILSKYPYLVANPTTGGLVYNPYTGLFYISTVYAPGRNMNIYTYNASNGATSTAYTSASSDQGFVSGNVESSFDQGAIYDPYSHGIVYASWGAYTSRKLLRLNSDNTLSTLNTGGYYNYWGSRRITVDASSGKIYNIGGWIGASNQFTNDGSSVVTMPTLSGVDIQDAVWADSYSGQVYAAGCTISTNYGCQHNRTANGYVGKVYKFTPSSGATVDLSSAYTTAVGTTTPASSITAGPAGTLFWGGASGTLASSTVPAPTQVGQSSTLVTAGSNIAHAKLTATATLGTGTATYYISNDNGATWQTVTSGVGITFPTSGTQLKYKIELTGNATVTSLSIAYDLGYTTGTLSNMKKDVGADAQWVSISWNVTLPSNTTVKFRTRGATLAQGASGLYSASWSDYYTATTTGGGGTAIKANGAGGASLPAYEYMEIEATLMSSDGVTSPAVNSISLSYAINAPPEFDTNYPSASAGGATATQISDSASENWGKVQIDYSLRDPDTSAGTATPGYITPSFSYRLTGSGSFIAINPTYLSSSATSNKFVSDSAYNTYTAYWDARSQIPTQYANIAEIKVTANDNEIIYNLGYATTSAMTIDTTAPTTSLLEINGSSSTSTIRVTAADDTTIKDYLISNNADYSADGSNATSGSWQTVGASTLTLNQAWTLAATSTTSTVYVAIRDIYGNVSSSTIIAPVAPSSFEIHDISNVSADTYKLFIAWTPYSNASGATFASYRLLRSTDGSNYSLFQTIADSSLNYYLDSSVASSTTYYYKLQVVDTNGDASAYTSVVSAEASGQGGSSLPPIISNVVIDNIKNTSARVTWDTNTLTNSTVNYGTTNSYGSTASGSSYVSSHSVYLNNLTADTTYYVRVGSTDFYTNTTTDDNGGAGYTFTTGSGTVISNVTTNSITDTSADVFWNTTTPSDSYVTYSTNADLSSPVLAGNGTLVSTTSSSGVYSHQVHLSGLSVSTTYYYKVQSTDANANVTTADNNGGYYSFLTTRDVTPPTISDISVPVITKTAAVIVWSTDKKATSQVEYGITASTTSGLYDTTTTLDSTLTPTHVITIEDLTENTPYYFRVKSSDAAGNSATSDEQTFTSAETDATVITRSGSGAINTSTAAKRNTTPPTISNITVGPINAFDATVQISGDPAFLANVQYGEVSSSSPSGAYSLFGSGEPTKYETSKSVRLTGLTPGTKYRFIASVVDVDGNMQKSAEQTFTTKYLAEDLGNLSALDKTTNLLNKLQDILESALPSISPPAIANPQVTDITEETATITWTTNIKAYGLVDYASEKDYATSTYASEVSDLDTTSKDHSIKLANLTPATKYHYSARSFVFPQVVGKSPDLTFTTKAGAITPQILDVKTDSFRVIWTTQNLTNSIIDYTDRKTGRTYTQKDTSYSTKHDVSAENLVSGSTYDVKAYGYDKDGALVSMTGTIAVTPALDTIPPNVTSLRIDSNLVPGRTDIIQSLVSWKTDKPSTSVVAYEEGSGAADQPLKNKVQNDTGFVKDHVVILPSLKPSTIYRIQVSSTDQAGNTLALPVRTIVTPQQTESIIDIIFKNFSDTFNFVGN